MTTPEQPENQAPNQPPVQPEAPQIPAPPAQPATAPVPPAASEQPTVQFPQTAPVAGAPVPPAAPAAPGVPAPVAGAPIPPQGPGAPVPPYQQPGAQVPAPQAPMNPLALVSFIGSFFVGLVGIICGHIALKQIKRDGSRGRGFALAGTIIGYVSVVGGLIATIFFIGALVTGAALFGTAASEAQKQIDSSELSISPSESTDPTETTAPSDGSSSSASPAFCDAIKQATEDFTASDTSGDAVLNVYKKLAETAPSEHKAVYQEMVDALQNPANVDASKLGDLQTRLQDAIVSDYTSCQ